MLKPAGALARELFQDALFDLHPSCVVERRLEAVVPVRENRQAHTQELSFGQDRLILLWLATKAVRTRSPVVQFESASQLLTGWGLSTGDEYYGRLASSFRRVFGSTIFFGTHADSSRSEVWDCSRIHIIDHVRLWFQHDCDADGRRRENLVTLSAPFWEELRNHPIPVDATVVRALANNPGCLDLYTWLTWRCYQARCVERIPLFGAMGLASQLGVQEMRGSANSASGCELGWNWSGCTGPNPRRGSPVTVGFSSWRMLRLWRRGDLHEQSTR